jgi:hypothetical protein
LFVSDLRACLVQPLRAIPSNISALVHPDSLQRQLLTDLETAKTNTALQQLSQLIGQSSVDVFGHDQSYALFNGLNYNQRPIFQSYLAYNSTLQTWNEQFYLSSNAPDFVLFNLAPIDRRFPPLEDARVLRDLLMNGQPMGEEKQFLLLKVLSRSLPKVALLKEGVIGFNQALDLNPFGQTNLWVEIDVVPSFLGRLRELVYKPSRLRLRVWQNSQKNSSQAYPAPASMLAAGFVASPLLLRRQDVARFYRGEGSARPHAMSIESGEPRDPYWKPQITYRIYSFQKGTGSTEP